MKNSKNSYKKFKIKNMKKKISKIICFVLNVVMLFLNFLLNCNDILKLSLIKLCFHFNELKMFQSPFILCILLLHSVPPHPIPLRHYSSISSFQHLPITVSDTYISSDKWAAGHRPRYSRAIHVFEVEVNSFQIMKFNHYFFFVLLI